MASNSVNVRFIIRNDTGANWTTKNPILKKGELGVNTDNGLLKIGDDIHAWNELSYINDPSMSKAAHYEGTAQDAETDEEVITCRACRNYSHSVQAREHGGPGL